MDFENKKTDLDPGVRSSSSEEPSDPMGSHKRQDNLIIKVLVTSPKRVNARPPIRRMADIPISTSPATFAEGGEGTGGLNNKSSQTLRDKEQGQELSSEHNQSIPPAQYFDNIDNEVFGIDQISSTYEQNSSPIISSSPSDMFGIGLETLLGEYSLRRSRNITSETKGGRITFCLCGMERPVRNLDCVLEHTLNSR